MRFQVSVGAAHVSQERYGSVANGVSTPCPRFRNGQFRGHSSRSLAGTGANHKMCRECSTCY